MVCWLQKKIVTTSHEHVYYKVETQARGDGTFELVVPAGAPPSFEHPVIEGASSKASPVMGPLSEASVAHVLVVTAGSTDFKMRLNVGGSPRSAGSSPVLVKELGELRDFVRVLQRGDHARVGAPTLTE